MIGAAIPLRNRGVYPSAPNTADMDDDNVLGRRIAALREAKGLSQPALAKLIGIAQPSLSDIESGKTRSLKGNTLAGLIKHLDVTAESLLDPSAESKGPLTLAEDLDRIAPPIDK